MGRYRTLHTGQMLMAIERVVFEHSRVLSYTHTQTHTHCVVFNASVRMAINGNRNRRIKTEQKKRGQAKDH